MGDTALVQSVGEATDGAAAGGHVKAADAQAVGQNRQGEATFTQQRLQDLVGTINGVADDWRGSGIELQGFDGVGEIAERVCQRRDSDVRGGGVARLDSHDSSSSDQGVQACRDVGVARGDVPVDEVDQGRRLQSLAPFARLIECIDRAAQTLLIHELDGRGKDEHTLTNQELGFELRRPRIDGFQESAQLFVVEARSGEEEEVQPLPTAARPQRQGRAAQRDRCPFHTSADRSLDAVRELLGRCTCDELLLADSVCVPEPARESAVSVSPDRGKEGRRESKPA